MVSLARRNPRTVNTWPGFVDALAALLMVVIFLLMVFVLAQFFLGAALSGRDAALNELRSQIDELSELLNLERRASEDMRRDMAQIASELQASLTARDQLSVTLRSTSERAEAAESRIAELVALADKQSKRAKSAEMRVRALDQRLKEADRTIAADKQTIATLSEKVGRLVRDVAALQALKEELERKVAELGKQAGETGEALIAERQISKSARAQVALLNKQLAVLREQLAQLTAALDAAEKTAKEQNIQIESLGKRLNAALAGKVQELARYRSEFFGRLRKVLGNQPGIRIVGDRFVFQSEVLFPSGSALLDAKGREQLIRVARTLKALMKRIPPDVPWILQVNGHTDTVPIHNERYASNWELSLARALSVVNLLVEEGIPPHRLAAAGFGEFQPIAAEDSEEARRRNRRIELKLTQP